MSLAGRSRIVGLALVAVAGAPAFVATACAPGEAPDARFGEALVRRQPDGTWRMTHRMWHRLESP